MNLNRKQLATIAIVILAITNVVSAAVVIDSYVTRSQTVSVIGPSFNITGTFPTTLLLNISVTFTLIVSSQVASLSWAQLFFNFEAPGASCSWFSFNQVLTRPNGSTYLDPVPCVAWFDANTSLPAVNYTATPASYLNPSSVTYTFRIAIRIVAVYAVKWGLRIRVWS